MSEIATLARWLLALELIGWGLYPILWAATPGLRDRGLTVAKPCALLLLTYPAWFVAALGLPVFSAPVLLALGVILAIAGWGLALRPTLGRRPAVASAEPATLATFLRQSWRYVILAEAIFVAAFLGYAWLRGFNPQILGTEKPMEIGFLSAATRERTMPPTDPWLSGYGINYYYLGYAIVAALAKLTGIASSTAFNLALATLFAATLTGGAGITANLLAWAGSRERQFPRARTLAAGLLGGYLLALAGNMYAAHDILDHGRQAIDAWWWGGLGWKSSRVVIDRHFPVSIFGPNLGPVETINEFPFFSFILGDLHAHVLALPFTLLALALALDSFLAPPLAGLASSDRPHLRWRYREAAGRIGLAALVVGALYALNSWDLPTYAAIYLAALLLPPFRRGQGLRRPEGIAAIAFIVGAFALYVPFHARFTSLVGGQPFDLPEPWRSIPSVAKISSILGVVIWGKTPADQFFTVYLLPYVAGLIFLVWRWAEGRKAFGQTGVQMPFLAVLTLALVATILRMPVLFFAGVIVLLAADLLLRPSAWAEPDDFVTLLFGAAFALVIVTEIFFVHDIFANRMNTVFKVYYQVWTLLAIAGGYAIVRVASGWSGARVANLWRLPAIGAVMLLLLASTAYPLAASRARTADFTDRQGLDGLDFVRTVQPDEWAGIRWVREHVPAGSVVAEAPGCSYGELNGLPHDRVSAFAGVSTPIGWLGHEQQWRGGSPAILSALGQRADDVNRLYRTTDPAEASAVMDRYGISYVYVGIFERNGYATGGIGADCRVGGAYPSAGLAKFDQMLDRVFVSGNVVVYQRR